VHGQSNDDAGRRADAHRIVPGLVEVVVIKNQRNRSLWTRHQRSPGVALVLCLFVLSIITVWLVDMLNSQTVYQSALRNSIEYEQALYLANAGIHHAVAELEQNTVWRGTVAAGGYPASGSYSATAVDGASAGTVDVTSTGVAGEVTRKALATVQQT
jgi:type II secretory pathway component PulK